MASAVGAVLVLALLVSAYAYEASIALPRNGRAAEDAWSGQLAGAATDLARRAGAGEAGATLVPPAPAGASVPLFPFGSATPLRAGGLVAFDPDCAAFNASHSIAGVVVPDLVNATRGCARVALEPAYGAPVTYVLEWGGVVRVQGHEAVVLSGPVLDVQSGANLTSLALALPDLEGDASSEGVGTLGGRLLLTPGRDAVDGVPTPNADNATWSLDTEHPAAWQGWLNASLARAGLGPSLASVSCDTPTCAVGANGRGRVTVQLAGPAGPSDLAISIAYRRSDLAFG